MQNIHSSHIEDLVIDGVDGLFKIMDVLDMTQTFCRGHGYENSISLKIDGSVSIVAGWLDDRFFVGSKSVFNKKPKINFSEIDIQANHTGELSKILVLCLELLRPVIPKGKIYQGDLLFYPEKPATSFGSHCIFHCNKIIYTVPSNSNLLYATIGIAFHTEYDSNFNLYSYVVHPEFLNYSDNVYVLSTLFKSPKVHIPYSEVFLDDFIHRLGRTPFHPEIKPLFLMYQNSFYREDIYHPTDPFEKAFYFEEWIAKRKETDKKKYDWFAIMTSINHTPIVEAFSVANYVTDVKIRCIEALNSVQNIKCSFYRKSKADINDAIESTNHEGYVITMGKAMGTKLVNRNIFSRANFSDDIIRGW